MKSMNVPISSYFTVITFFLSFQFLSFTEKNKTTDPDLKGQSTAVIGVAPEGLKKDHLIFVFNPFCGKCRKAAIKVQKMQEKTGNVTGLTAEDFKNDLPALRDSLNLTFPIVTTDKPRLKTYFRHIPDFVYVQKGIITEVVDSLK